MKFMVALRRGTSFLTSKLLLVGLCLGFHTSYLRAQAEDPTPPPAETSEPAPSTETPTPEATPPTGETAPTEGMKPEEEGLGEKIKEKVKELKTERGKNRKETTDALIKRRGKDPEKARYVMPGVAQTLPEKVVRARYVYRNLAGNQSYEEGGNKKDVGIDAVVNANAYAFEYGLTDKISLQLLVPMIASNKVTINANKFKDSKVYQKKYNELMEVAVPYLIGQGQCSDEASCLNKINNEEFSIKTDVDLVLPTGEVGTLKGGVPIERGAFSLITNAAKTQEGATGLSDITLASLVNVYNSPSQMVSIGAGLRLPTSKAEDEKSYKRTGSGFTSLGVALQYDYRIADPLIASFSNTTEIHLKSPKYKRYSQVNPDELNEADPNTIGAELKDENGNPTPAPGKGDKVSNNFKVTRKVPLNTGYVRLGYALGDLHSSLSSITVGGSYGWTFDPEQYYDGDAQQNGSKSTRVSYELNFDGLGLQPRIPIGFSISQDRLLSGENVTVAAVNTYLSLILYYKF